MKHVKRFIVIVVAVIVVAGVAALLLSRHNRQHPELDVASVTMPYSDGRLHAAPGIDFVLAVGSPHSTITRRSIEMLKSHGMKVDSGVCIAWVRRIDGNVRMATRRFTVSLPITDTAGDITGRLHNVHFLEARPGETSILGADILEHFALEYDRTESLVTLHVSPPTGYTPLATLSTPLTMSTLTGFGHTYYMPANVHNHGEHQFRLETGLWEAHMRLPAADSIKAQRDLHTAMLATPYGDVEMKLADKVWVRSGDRAGSHPVYYGDYRHWEPYSINPFNFFAQDILIDFPSRQISLPTRPGNTDL